MINAAKTHTYGTILRQHDHLICVFAVTFDCQVQNTWYWQMTPPKSIVREVRARQGRPSLTVAQNKCHNFGYKSAYGN